MIILYFQPSFASNPPRYSGSWVKGPRLSEEAVSSVVQLEPVLEALGVPSWPWSNTVLRTRQAVDRASRPVDTQSVGPKFPSLVDRVASNRESRRSRRVEIGHAQLL